MSFREDVFSDLQNDLCCPLLADEYFSDIHVIDYRKEDIVSEIELALSTTSPKTGNIGICVVVLPLVVTDPYRAGGPDHPRRPRGCRVTYRVLENPLFNNGASGTGKSALAVASRIGRVLKHYTLEGLATGLVPDDQYIVPIDDDLAPVAYEVGFNCLEVVDQNYAKCAPPQFSLAGSTLTITTATPDATIYYTFDGGYPHPSNPNGHTVTQYTTPVSVTGQVLVRAGVFKENHIPSDIAAAILSDGTLNEEGDAFGDLQNDLCCPLLADEYFSDIHVIDYRKEDIASEIESGLSTITAKAGKLGVVVIAMPLVVADTFTEGDFLHPRECRVAYRVLEHPLFNNGASGTRKAALSVCSRLGHVLKHYALHGLATNLVPDEIFIVPIEDPLAPVAYEVRFTCFDIAERNLVRCAQVAMDYDPITGVLQLSCSTPGATIYYTKDGGYPHPTNPNAFTVLTYSSPITIEGEVLIRAGAFLAGYMPSSITAARFDLIGDGLGGALGTEGSVSPLSQS